MAEAAPTPRLLQRYRDSVVPALQERFKSRTPMEIPRVTKVSVNVGLGEALVERGYGVRWHQVTVPAESRARVFRSFRTAMSRLPYSVA